MSAIDDLLRDVPLPRMVKVAQFFERPTVDDVEDEVARKMRGREYLTSLKPGMLVAVTAGSRGITNMPLIIRSIVHEVRAAGGEPFIFPAMGSHGGATAEGQRTILQAGVESFQRLEQVKARAAYNRDFTEDAGF